VDCIIVPRNKKRKNGRTLRYITWNVRTMCPGISDDLTTIMDFRKTAVIDRELDKLKVDVAALQETRLPGAGSLREANYTFYWQGGEPHEPRRHGVGFAVRNNLLSLIEEPTGGTDRMLTLKLKMKNQTVNFINVYSPTLHSTEDIKDAFYEAVDAAVGTVPPAEKLFLLGDFNARVGDDYEAWPSCIGRFGVGKLNSSGQRLLELCTHHGLCVTNTFFSSKLHHRVFWWHPRSGRGHQLDMIITRRSSLYCVLNTRSYHSADCDTDHSLVCAIVKEKFRTVFGSRQARKSRIDVDNARIPELKTQFQASIGESLQNYAGESIEEKWKEIRQVIVDTAIASFGIRKRENPDWFKASLAELNPVMDLKRGALIAHKCERSATTSDALKKARSVAQRTARRCANEYWVSLAEKIQRASECGDARTMYGSMKQALGPKINKTIPIWSCTGDPITDPVKQMERWAEFFGELYSDVSIVTEPALDGVQQLPLMQELDALPTVDDLKRAIDTLTSGKSPGGDNIPPEVIKAGKDSPLTDHLYDLLCQCWVEGCIPQDMRDANIITIYKNKGNRSDCNNHSAISLLSVVGKAFVRVVLSRWQSLADRVYPETQCGFRAGRSTTDMVFSLRQLQEKCREQRMPLCMAFVDLTKAFDLVSRGGLFSVLRKIGCPPKLLALIVSFHENTMGTVQCSGRSSNSFPTDSGVKQGCVLAPTLFGIFFSVLLSDAFDGSQDGVWIHTRHDGGLFNLARLRSKTKIKKVLLRELLFADDAALVAHSETSLQRLVDRLSESCDRFGLKISLSKTNILSQDLQEEPTINIGDHTLRVFQEFTYLGSTVTSNLSLNVELDRRIGRAAAVMSKLAQRVWNNAMLTISTKVAVYTVQSMRPWVASLWQ
jgi:hypothetical protein